MPSPRFPWRPGAFLEGQAMLDFLRKKKTEKPALSALWEETDEDRFVTALSARVAEKCAYGDDLAALSPAERVFYLAQTCEEEVNNGGFDQLLFNASGSCRRPSGPSARRGPRTSAPRPWRPWAGKCRRTGKPGGRSWHPGRDRRRSWGLVTRHSSAMRRTWRPGTPPTSAPTGRTSPETEDRKSGGTVGPPALFIVFPERALHPAPPV